MKKKKRFLSLALALVLCLGLLPTAAGAAETTPLRNCRGATEVTVGEIPVRLTNPILDVVEIDENSIWYYSTYGGKQTYYVVPTGTEFHLTDSPYDDPWEEFCYTAEKLWGCFLGYGADAFHPVDDEEYGFVVRGDPVCMWPEGDGFSRDNSALFYGIWQPDDELMTPTEHTVVDLTQYGPVVFSNVAAKKSISVEGETVPLYEVRENSGFWKDFKGVHGTCTVYDATVENGQLTKGEELFTWDTSKEGANTYCGYTYVPEDVGQYQFVEITGEPTYMGQDEVPQPTLRFTIHVVADQPTAYTSTQEVLVDGKAVTFSCYALKDAAGNMTNYIKLRDLADILNGTLAQFAVGWDGAVTITTKTAYTPNGSEGNTPFSGNRSYQEATAATKVNGQSKDLAAFVLNDDQGGGYTYYKLRDLAQALGFNVGWSADKGIYLETDKPYDPNN